MLKIISWVYFVFVFFALVSLFIRELGNEVILHRFLRSGRIANGDILREYLNEFIQCQIIEDTFILRNLLKIRVTNQQAKKHEQNAHCYLPKAYIPM